MDIQTYLGIQRLRLAQSQRALLTGRGYLTRCSLLVD